MRVLGIDPGTKRIGYGIIEKEKGKTELLDVGILKIKSKDEINNLSETKDQVSALIKKWKPEVLAIEKLFFMKNQKTAMQVAEARGVILLAGFENKLKIKEYSPNEIKAAITGYGFADKKSVAKMVKLILKIPNLKVIDDATDALAIALVACSY